MMTDEALDALVQGIGQILIDQKDAIRSLVSSVSDEDVMTLADRLESSMGCHGFRVYAFDLVANDLRSEVGTRAMFLAASEHMNRTGGTFYCPFCKGRCGGVETHGGSGVPPSNIEMKLREMKIEDVIRTAVAWHGEIPR